VLVHARALFLVVQLCGRTLRVDHVENYRLPKHLAEKEAAKSSGGSDAILQPISAVQAGHAYEGTELASQFTLKQGQDLFAPRPPPSVSQRQGSFDRSDGDDKNETRRDDDKKRKKDKETRRMAKETRRRERHAQRMEREERRRQRRAQSVISTTADHVDADRHARHRRSRSRHEDSPESSGSNDSDVSRRKQKRRKHS
jgi:hypothetical protein